MVQPTIKDWARREVSVSKVAANAPRTLWRMMCMESHSRTLGVEYGDGPAPDAHRLDSIERIQDVDSIELSQSSQDKGEESASQDDIELSGEQKAVLRMVLEERKSIFFTGAAGTGKSVLLRELIKRLKVQYGNGAVAVTALTGIAACNIGGQTLHRWAGVGTGEGPVDQLVRRMTKQGRASWKFTEVLLIDEISMLNSGLLERLEEIARVMRKTDKPFGGIQLVLTGDLFQLPPISKDRNPSFCFETPIWSQLVQKTAKLTKVFRQKEPEFIRVLNELRMGEISPETIDLFNSLSRPPKLPKGIVPTQLFATRKQVSEANARALASLPGTMYEYTCSDWYSMNLPKNYVNLNTDCPAPEELQLRVGAQVILTKNIDKTLVNGSIGKVVGFVTPEQSMRVKDEGAERTASHSKEVLEFMGRLNSKHRSSARKRILAEDLTNEQAKSATVLPIVKYTLNDNTTRTMIMQPETWSVTNSENEIIASRCQIPLALSWALSIHKSQGQTLPYLSVNLNNIFASGQAYVAISRATSLAGLQLFRFNPYKVTAEPKVKQFYLNLPSISDRDIQLGEEFLRQLDRTGYSSDIPTQSQPQDLAPLKSDPPDLLSDTDPEDEQGKGSATTEGTIVDPVSTHAEDTIADSAGAALTQSAEFHEKTTSNTSKSMHTPSARPPENLTNHTAQSAESQQQTEPLPNPKHTLKPKARPNKSAEEIQDELMTLSREARYQKRRRVSGER